MVSFNIFAQCSFSAGLCPGSLIPLSDYNMIVFYKWLCLCNSNASLWITLTVYIRRITEKCVSNSSVYFQIMKTHVNSAALYSRCTEVMQHINCENYKTTETNRNIVRHKHTSRDTLCPTLWQDSIQRLQSICSQISRRVLMKI